MDKASVAPLTGFRQRRGTLSGDVLSMRVTAGFCRARTDIALGRTIDGKNRFRWH
jgi:hypothetical protein